MNFHEFIAWSAAIREPDVERLCETRISRAFADLRPQLDLVEPPRKLHRCDLARAWCELRGLPASAGRTAMICSGVRHALSLLFAHMAAAGRRLALPTDVYPVYWELARAAGVTTFGVPTFPELAIDAVLDHATRAEVAALVLPDPLKLHGRRLDAAERAALVAWLGRDPHRRLVVDGVYAFGGRLDRATLELLDTGQVLYLDSLSKGWLHAGVFGVAHLPARDFDHLGPLFRAAAPSQAQLHLAARLMTDHAELPAALVAAIDVRRSECIDRLRARGLAPFPVDRGYLVGVAGDARELLHTHRVLLLPGSVFGEPQRQVAIASALPPAM
ncbi:pyridoxal phosphate-dependent aminotransferase [Nannocystis radixulma]|uniref:Pyridoxal phosphate-dependent aminotransferase n=1 Tax=Nannocystis radixulma TaxID=2995305 RepID=A0ABT5AXQ3_9BACT|nr:pyridoxal phosphate-dependent aminotransferase [Nannocystis radixulma]MDC0666611.1 pyridoxal phosphate-dependent aminotransferase [Nannocystis radixulma]